MTFCVLSISELSLSVRTPRRSISHAHKRLHTHSLHIKNAAASAARPMHALLLLLLLLTVSSSLFSQQASPVCLNLAKNKKNSGIDIIICLS